MTSISPAAFRVMREYLKLSLRTLSELLEVELAQTQKWETGVDQIPDSIGLSISEIDALTTYNVTENVRRLNDRSDVSILTYRTDDEFWEDQRQMRPYSASWNRGLMARIASEVPGLSMSYSSPDEVPFDEDLMTSAEMRVVREYLGLSVGSLASLLFVAEPAVSKWEAGTEAIPHEIAQGIERLEAYSADCVRAAIGHLSDARDVRVFTFRSDADFWHCHPDMTGVSASSDRMLIARANREVFGLEIQYWDSTWVGSS